MYDFARYLNIRSANSPAVSPDGAHLAFLSDISGNFQVWSMALGQKSAQPWPRQLTFFTDKVWEVHGTHRASHLIAVSDMGGNERQQFYLISNYGVDETGVAKHDVRCITVDDRAIHRFGDWSRDGQSIVYTCNARNNVDFDIYQLDLQTGGSLRLRECDGRRQIVGWLGNDRYVLSADAQATEQIELYLLDLERDEERHLTEGQAWARYGSVVYQGSDVYLISDRFHDRGALCRLSLADGTLTPLLTVEQLERHIVAKTGELDQVCLTRAGDMAAISVNAEGYNHLFLVDLNGASSAGLSDDKIRYMADLPAGVIEHITFGGPDQSLYFDFQSPDTPQDIWKLNVPSGSVAPVTHSDRAGIDSSTFVRPQLIQFPTFDDRRLPAFLFRPQQEPPAAGYPCIFYVHGGPAGQQRPDFDVRFQYFLNEGYTLFVPNVRGSTGYGREYVMLDDVEKRMDSVKDLHEAVRWLHEQPDIDANRIAIYGRSYGGFMVLAALTEYPDHFAAGIDVVGIADWETFLERTSPWRRAHREREYGSLANHRSLLRQISPLHKADRITAPLLVIAGDNDPRVPLYESEQIVEKVRATGGIVAFKHYTDEGHKISKLANRIDSFNTMAAFLHTYIKERPSERQQE